MDTSYEILGLAPDASQEEIKKAYFKMVRRYSPESDPQQFQIIRRAYEQLKKGPQDKPELPVFPALTDPLAIEMMQQVQAFRKEKNLPMYLESCEEAWRRFPEHVQFLYLLVMAQRKSQKTGKAVKNAELLASKDPENKWFQKELACCYMERGFKNKAYAAFERAYELGNRDNEFLIAYAGSCDQNSRYEKGVSVLLEIIRKDTRWTRDDIRQLAEAYSGLLCMDNYGSREYLSEILGQLLRHLGQYSIYLKESIPPLLLVIARSCTYPASSSTEFRQLQDIFSAVRRLFQAEPERETIEAIIDSYYYQRADESELIGNTLKRYLEIFHVLKDADASYIRFAMTDTQLCMIEEREEILEQAGIIRLESPPDYERIAPFIQKLAQDETLPLLKSSLQKTYRCLEPRFPGGYYYRAYPDEKRAVMGAAPHEGNEHEPSVQNEHKTDRNALCPCGSGKKYKHCCMKK